MKDFFLDILTDLNGDWDEIRIGAALSFLSLTVTQMWDVWGLHHAFNPQSYGIGLGSLLGAAGAAIGYKSRKEYQPNASDPAQPAR